MHFILLLGRILYSGLFLIIAIGHFTPQMTNYAYSLGVPMAAVIVPLFGVIVLLGALSVLIGFKARYGAWLLVLFIVPVTLTMHAFWMAQTPMEMSLQQAMFFKNLSLLGAALMITYFGSGPLSLDNRKRK